MIDDGYEVSVDYIGENSTCYLQCRKAYKQYLQIIRELQDCNFDVSIYYNQDDEIGELEEEWNWLDGHSDININPKNVHFTTGGPWFENWKPQPRFTVTKVDDSTKLNNYNPSPMSLTPEFLKEIQSI